MAAARLVVVGRECRLLATMLGARQCSMPRLGRHYSRRAVRRSLCPRFAALRLMLGKLFHRTIRRLLCCLPCVAAALLLRRPCLTVAAVAASTHWPRRSGFGSHHQRRPARRFRARLQVHALVGPGMADGGQRCCRRRAWPARRLLCCRAARDSIYPPDRRGFAAAFLPASWRISVGGGCRHLCSCARLHSHSRSLCAHYSDLCRAHMHTLSPRRSVLLHFLLRQGQRHRQRPRAHTPRQSALHLQVPTRAPKEP